MVAASDDPSARAILVPGSGTYSRKFQRTMPKPKRSSIRGLRLAWGFYFPGIHSVLSEASRLDPTHPMPYWGMAHAMGPNQTPVMHECLMIRRRRT